MADTVPGEQSAEVLSEPLPWLCPGAVSAFRCLVLSLARGPMKPLPSRTALNLMEKGMALDHGLARSPVGALLFLLGVEIVGGLRICFEKRNRCWLPLGRSWFNIPSDVSSQAPALG